MSLSDRVNFYVINLDRSTDRMERFAKSFATFPLPYIRVSAVDGKLLNTPIENFNNFMFWFNTGRAALLGEIGCYLSHLNVLKTFLESDKEFAMICEDDAAPAPGCHETIQEAIDNSGSWDLLRLYGCRRKTSFPYLELSHSRHLCTSITSLVETRAYMVNRRAAKKLLRNLSPMTAAYDVALFKGHIGIKEATVLPNCIIRDESSGNTSTIQDGAKRNLRPWHLVYWTCRLHRLWVRTTRYSLQFLRMINRRLKAFARK